MTHSTVQGPRRTLLRKVLPTIVAASIGAAGLVGCSGGSDSGGHDGTADKAGAAADTAAGKSALSRDTKVKDKDPGLKLKTTSGEFGTKAAAAADFPTWGTRWVVHQTPDTHSASTGMINQRAAGQDRIAADYQVDTGHKVCEDGACSTYMAHLTKPVNGFLSVVAVDISQDSLPDVPVQNGDQPPKPPQTGGTRC
ncbi:hypothetical protein [Streptomyces coffeae]|uniref:Lipoprotein n=1 Tax=Streptomyces coffeae TaxID=621382 RepID=A0ABS1N7U3_9ACTN|nr:hypothetical protein [Streptomyces coffeae]MBL1096155.1 hypothetical protein [Streptomyces coffeae]